MYALQPPSIAETPEAPKLAAARLQQLGRLSQDEIVMLATVAVALSLWVSKVKGGGARELQPLFSSLNLAACIQQPMCKEGIWARHQVMLEAVRSRCRFA